MVLNPVISKLSGKLVVLASSSPRRLEILRNAGLRFEVVPSWFKETLNKQLFKAPHEYAVETAKQKALEVARRMPIKHLKTPDMVIGADTIVAVDGMILEKPVDKQDAYRMLSSLSGKEHSVFTGVAIVLCHEKDDDEVDYQMIDFYEETKVKFADLSQDMLWEYINSGEPMDKAGGYGIQALGGMLVEYVHGDFLNVVGFPLNHFCKQLDIVYNHCSFVNPETTESVYDRHSAPILIEQKDSSTSIPRPRSPSASPLHKVKKKDRETEAKVNSSSKQDAGEIKVHNSETTILSVMRSREGCIIDQTEPKKGDLELIYELMDGFKASKALFTASKFSLFDVLHKKPGLDAEQIAQEIEASVKGTETLLEACVSLGLLKTKDTKRPKPGFENTDAASCFLRSDSHFSLHAYIQHCDDTLWPVFCHLESAVREGTSQRGKVKASTEICQEAKLRFMHAMHSSAKVAATAVATAFDLSSYKTACDVGGCTGAIAYELIKIHPDLSVAVLDLPAVVEMSAPFQRQHTDKRVTFKAGDFLTDELPKADLYILVRVLHDLTDEKLHILLGRISDACTPGCGLLLSEIFLDENRSGPSRGLLQALSMSEGKQRSAAEYSRLLKGHGFITAQVKHTNSLLDAMLCTKAEQTCTLTYI
ncbi:probable bifunctional dTTP/UTP pyrophosphatase/methyltransferase protein isoform X2 [Gambusia affinis]|uniref:probable bifunctional dTTP/UTP pyrophosphatase/methyltransferase protein isoform X2 n=1 Tax=Gambusia affinis TaxID=33528 RepID=UPI001CDC0060|nr:probable bifunctional dTTP/UTP pyrophosphatase/methyltransferase protein isoform X2 [Gambusia affinis]XP_043987992.1 probable bifunctional dTTP/UTP pyrophosphatase/methyltransferase protein isoform X2 [Gambusia affinis]